MQDGMQEVVSASPVFDFDTPEFLFTEIFFRQNNQLYCTKSKTRFLKGRVIPRFDINDREVFLVPLNAYQVEWHDGITKYEVPDSVPADVFIKTPRLMDYDPTSPYRMVSRVQPEVKILEKIKADKDGRLDNMGENIVEYYGCTQSSDRLFITGVCLKKYPRMLMNIADTKDRMLEDQETSQGCVSTDPKDAAEYVLPSSPEKVIKGLIKGLQYLHKLDIIHNNINLANVMFDEDGRPIIIDFNIGLWRGEKVFGGTIGWMDCRSNSPTTAIEDIDIRALYRIVLFMHENFCLDDLDPPTDYNGDDDDFALVKRWLAERIDCAKAWLTKDGGNEVDPLYCVLIHLRLSITISFLLSLIFP